MQVRWILIGLVALSSAGCRSEASPAPLTAVEALSATDSARAFVDEVAKGVTRDGPAAWRRYFAASPDFFMAAEGRLVFANHDAALQGIAALTKVITRIDLRWGSPLQVYALTNEVVVVAAPYHESRVDVEGHAIEEDGYFTGLAVRDAGGWRFRNAHWSVAPASSQVP